MSDAEGDSSSKKEGTEVSSSEDISEKLDTAPSPSPKEIKLNLDDEDGTKSQDTRDEVTKTESSDNAKSDNTVEDKSANDGREPMEVEDVSPCASPAENSDKVKESPSGSPMSVDDNERTEAKSQDIAEISECEEKKEEEEEAEKSPENDKKAVAEASAEEVDDDDSALPETILDEGAKMDASSDNDPEESKPTSKEINSGDEDETSNASVEKRSSEEEPEVGENRLDENEDDENKNEESDKIERLKGDDEEEKGKNDAESEDAEKVEEIGPIIVRVLGTTDEEGASDKESEDEQKGDAEEEENGAGNIVISEVKSCVETKDNSNEESQSKVESKEDDEENVDENKVDADEIVEDKKDDNNEDCDNKPEVMDVEEEEDEKEVKKNKDDEDDGKDEKESEMPTLEILDVRTVTEEENSLPDKKHEETDESNEIKDAESNDEETKTNKDASVKSDSSEKSSGIEAIANKLTKKSKKSTDDNEMKNYAADTMNELLGLFGYDKVDETMKDAIQLSNNLSGPSEKDGKKAEGDKPDIDATAKGDEKVESKEEVKKEIEGKEKKDGTDKHKASEKVAAKTTSEKAVGKTLQKRECSFCGKTKPCKYQVLMLGTTKFLCDDNCFKDFRTKQHIVTAPAIKDIIAQNRPITRSLMHPKDFCNSCHKEIKNGMGLLPGVGENKPLCSEECMKNYQATQGLKRACAQCGNHILSRSKCLTWEAMEFCNEECLGKYQSYLGSHCAYCNNAVQQTSLGKYCVRFGSDIKQFCSNGCLEEFKKGLKVCSYCQKDISSGTEGFLAPVGDKGQFKEFCSQSCMEKYETMGTVTPSQPSIEQCSVCNKVTSVKVEVTYANKVHKLCSEPCIAAFRYANKINTSICDTCHKFFDLDVTCQLTIQFEGTSKRFCTKACMNVFVLYHRKVVPCSWCKVKKYNFDMIERVDSNNHVQLFCSLNCLSLFRVSLNATSSKRIQCDFCHQVKPAQYHLTMSDASIRNFCSYNCVMQFQGQFTGVTPVVAAPTPQPTTTKTTTATTQSGTPVISSVMSLAPGQTQTATKQTVQNTVAVRTQALPVQTITKTIVHKVAGTQTVTPTITQQVIIKQPHAKPQKNKMLMCRPMTQTKGVSCKPHPCHKSSQTDGEYRENPVFIPIPVPIFVPVPMRMYSTPVPFPVAFPLPIPVPIFIPTTKDSAQSIFKQIKEIQQKIPNNPFEADLILMAEMVAEDSTAKGKAKALTGKRGAKAVDGESSSNDASSDKQEEGFVVETSLPDSCPPTNTFGDEVLQMALRMASSMQQPVDLENALSNQSQDLNSTSEENGSYLSARELRGQARNHKRTGSRGRGRGRKRARVDDALEREADSPTPLALPPPTPPVATQFDFRPIGGPQLESNCVLKFSYGVNAWKHWVLQKNTQLEKASQTNRKLKLFKTDILQLSADELNYSLCLFIKEVRKPNGDEYAPDSIYYLCLGIQQYLFENGRIDNIFSDAYYEKFTECLNEVLQRYEATLTSDGCFLSRIEEEILWECKQLGAHSPHVLLNTLMYFNTKFFMLKSIDDHLQLSFSHILKHWKKSPGSTAKGSPGGRNVLLRYYPPSQIKDSPRRRKEAIPSYEQVENLDNPLRCPVKLYEFYLSKCPESIKNRNDIFYLYPERSCVPDSPVWYSTMSLGKETIAKMLQRIRMVREVGDNITTT